MATLWQEMHWMKNTTTYFRRNYEHWKFHQYDKLSTLKSDGISVTYIKVTKLLKTYIQNKHDVAHKVMKLSLVLFHRLHLKRKGTYIGMSKVRKRKLCRQRVSAWQYYIHLGQIKLCQTNNTWPQNLQHLH